MNMRLPAEIAAMAMCYLILAMPLAAATSVRIQSGGTLAETVDYNPANLVNQQITYVKDPRDISWANVRIAMNLNSASLAHTITRVYLYKCGALSPSSCMQKTPEVFDTYVDTEIAWADISESTGSTPYPQEGNILFLVKLRDPDGLESWIGLWNTIRRNSHSEFLFYRHELSEITVHAKTPNLVGPIVSYITNFNTIPFRWLTSVVFDEAESIVAIGGDDQEIDSSPPVLQSVDPPGLEIDVINKENYFVFPKTASGYAFPITLEKNPDFECGDRRCEANLGENGDTCCFDCGCDSGQYCDAPQGSLEDGFCKSSANVGLEIVGTPTAEVTDCSSGFDVSITARITNIPASMSDDVSGVIRVATDPFAVECLRQSEGLYQCSFPQRPTLQCGSGLRTIGPGDLKLTVHYMDGPNDVTEDLTANFPTINVNYDCDCETGYYCDTGGDACQTEDSIALGVTELTSYLDAYTPGDNMNLKVKIFNPPTGTVLVSASAGLNLTNAPVSPGTPRCTLQEPTTDYVYDCNIPFSITGYSAENNYKFEPNVLNFEITYNDGSEARTQRLYTEFGPISIPAQNCGNSRCDVSENPGNCCLDCGCENSGDYCDVSRGCASMSSVTMTATAYPTELTDCKVAHDVNVQVEIPNAPYGMQVDFFNVQVNNQPVAWPFDCSSTTGNIYDCQLSVPPQDGCQLPFTSVGPNDISFSVSYPNGDPNGPRITQDISASMGALTITPIPHIDGLCEPGLGESGNNTCVDCPCETEPGFGPLYYCDTTTTGGMCLPKSNIFLQVEDPTSTVSFDSCEKTNTMSVIMRVANQPANMRVEARYATINDQSAYTNCRESTGIFMNSNTTFNCSIRVPSVSDCKSGQVYTYDNNSISIVISYDNGQGPPILIPLTADLPRISISQTYRSMHEITDEVMTEMKGVLDKIIDITEEMMDQMETCMELQIANFVIGMIGSIAMGVAGGRSTANSQTVTDGKVVDGSFFDGFSKGVKTGGEMSKQSSTMIKSYCDMLQKMSQMQIEYQKLQIEKIKMNMCLAIQQHNYDSGKCKGNYEGCFDSVVRCLGSLKDMSGIVNNIGDLTSSMNQDAVNANNAMADMFDALGDAPWGGSPGGVSQNQYLSVKLKNSQGGITYLSPNQLICKYDETRSASTESQCKYNTLVVTKVINADKCKEPFISHKDTNNVERKTGSEIILSSQTEGKHTINLRCPKSDKTITELTSSEDIKDDSKIIESLTYTAAGKYVGAECMCQFQGNKPFTGVYGEKTSQLQVGETSDFSASTCGYEIGETWKVTGTRPLTERKSTNTGQIWFSEKCKLYSGSTIEVTSKTNPPSFIKNNQYNREYWWVKVLDSKTGANNCLANTEGFYLACEGNKGYLTDGSGSSSGSLTGGTSTLAKKPRSLTLPTQPSSVVTFIGSGRVLILTGFQSADTFVNQDYCILPGGTILDVFGHTCIQPSGENMELWINYNIETLGPTAGISDACYAGTNLGMNNYWAKLSDNDPGCSTSSLSSVITRLESEASNIQFSPEGETPETSQDTLSLQGSEASIPYKIICKLGTMTSTEAETRTYAEHNLPNWECGRLKGCQETSYCGDGYYTCPSYPFDGFLIKARDYGSGERVSRLNPESHDGFLCEDARIPCTSDNTCNDIFDGENLCLNGFCDYQEADFFFANTDILL